MNSPLLISSDSFQEAWAKAIFKLQENKWSAWNIIVQVKKPLLLDKNVNSAMTEFANKFCDGLTPKKVAFTIFPYSFYYEGITRAKLYRAYNIFYRRTRKMEHSGWGTYFDRMTHYLTEEGEVDQLGKIIDHINDRKNTHGCSHTILIPKPNKDFDRTMGAPCLNYLTVQVEKTENEKHINILAVYRNHDFLNRAYGNYFGLSELLKYIAFETNNYVGTLTCISSHAYVKNNKSALFNIAKNILES